MRGRDGWNSKQKPSVSKRSLVTSLSVMIKYARSDVVFDYEDVNVLKSNCSF